VGPLTAAKVREVFTAAAPAFEVLTRTDEAIADSAYLAIVSQFVVTASKP
jgi:hypothetical protein